MEPIGNLANVEELDLKTRQRTGCAEVRARQGVISTQTEVISY